MKKNRRENSRAVGIVRVSSKRQEDNVSCKNQEAEIREYCSQQKLELIEIVSIVESAKNSDKRKLYHSAIEKLLKHQHYNLLFYMADRETRNLTDAETIEKLVIGGEIQVHYVKDRKVLNKDSSAGDFFMRDISAAMAKQFSIITGHKISSACRHKAEDGWYPGNNPPLGYENHKPSGDGSPSRRGMCIIRPSSNELEIGMVRREFELRAQGLAYREIRKIVLSEGWPARLNMKSYHTSSIDHRLKNPFYQCKFLWKEVLYEGKHEGIIDEVALNKVNQLEGTWGRPAPTSLKNHSPLANGFLKCADPACGCYISYDPKQKILSDGSKKTYKLYHCTNGKGVHKSLKGMSANEETIMKQFSKAVELISLSDDFATEITKALKEAHQRSKSGIIRQIDQFKLELDAIDKKRSGLIQMRLSGEISQDDFEFEKKNLEILQSDKQKRMKSLTVMIHDAYAETAESILELSKDAKSLWEKRSLEDKVKFLRVILSNQRLDGVSIEFNLKTEWRVLSEMNENENWSSL